MNFFVIKLLGKNQKLVFDAKSSKRITLCFLQLSVLKEHPHNIVQLYTVQEEILWYFAIRLY